MRRSPCALAISLYVYDDQPLAWDYLNRMFSSKETEKFKHGLQIERYNQSENKGAKGRVVRDAFGDVRYKTDGKGKVYSGVIEGKWYPGKIEADHRDGTFNIRFDDGDKKLNAKSEDVKLVDGAMPYLCERHAGRARRRKSPWVGIIDASGNQFEMYLVEDNSEVDELTATSPRTYG